MRITGNINMKIVCGEKHPFLCPFYHIAEASMAEISYCLQTCYTALCWWNATRTCCTSQPIIECSLLVMVWLSSVDSIHQEWILKANGQVKASIGVMLKEFHEIINEARPLLGFFPHTCWFFYRSFDPSSNCFTIDVWK